MAEAESRSAPQKGTSCSPIPQHGEKECRTDTLLDIGFIPSAGKESEKSPRCGRRRSKTAGGIWPGLGPSTTAVPDLGPLALQPPTWALCQLWRHRALAAAHSHI